MFHGSVGMVAPGDSCKTDFHSFCNVGLPYNYYRTASTFQGCSWKRICGFGFQKWFPLILSVFLAFLGFYNRNRFIWRMVNPESLLNPLVPSLYLIHHSTATVLA